MALRKQVPALQMLMAARAALILAPTSGMVFFGMLAYRLAFVEEVNNRCPWLATDGKRLYYNAKGVEKWPIEWFVGALCHEICHCMLGHVWRRGNRDRKLWNQACDYVVNLMVKEAGLQLPPDVLYDRKYRGMTAEHVYELLLQEAKDSPAKPGPEQTEGMEIGDIWDDLEPDAQTTQDNWQVNTVTAAAQAKRQHGELPKGIEQLVDDIKHPQVDWRAAMRRFLQATSQNDYSWRRPNKRYRHLGYYLPEFMALEGLPPVAFLFDTSGSRNSADARAEAAAEFTNIVQELMPEKVYMIYHDSKVQRVDEFERGEDVEFRPIGGGGTNFACCFEYIEENGIEIAAAVGVTDLDGTFPDEEPPYPVLWACVGDEEAPFGERLQLG